MSLSHSSLQSLSSRLPLSYSHSAPISKFLLDFSPLLCVFLCSLLIGSLFLSFSYLFVSVSSSLFASLFLFVMSSFLFRLAVHLTLSSLHYLSSLYIQFPYRCSSIFPSLFPYFVYHRSSLSLTIFTLSAPLYIFIFAPISVLVSLYSFDHLSSSAYIFAPMSILALTLKNWKSLNYRSK